VILLNKVGLNKHEGNPIRLKELPGIFSFLSNSLHKQTPIFPDINLLLRFYKSGFLIKVDVP